MAKKDLEVEIKVQSVTEHQIATIRSMNCVLTLESNLLNATERIYELRIRLDNLNSLSEVIAYLAKEKAIIIGITHQEPSLEDAFLDLTESGG